MKSKFFYTTALLFAFVVSSVSASAQTTTEAPKSDNGTIQTIKIKVSGVTCSGDVKDIQGVVSKMEGVTVCKPIGKPSANSVFEVSFNPALISQKQIQKAVENTPGCEDPNDRPYKVKKG